MGYGVLIDVRNWYFFKWDNVGCFKILVGIMVSVEFLCVFVVLLYLVYVVVVDNFEFGDLMGNG